MLILFIAILGLCVGSFLNCLIYRLHEKKTILGRSFCPHCKKQISWHDNIPLLSFIWLRGRCRHCRRKISWQYPIIELATGILFVLVFVHNFSAQSGPALGWQFPIPSTWDNFQFLARMIFQWLFVSILVIIFIYDLRWYIIPDIITLPAMALVLLVNLYLGVGWLNLLLAAGIGGGFFGLQYLVSRGRWIGGGDIRLGVLMGIILGYPQIITALMLAYISGSAIGVALLTARKKQWSSQIPFGTFLSAATVITMLWGEEILGWYLNLL